MAGRRIRGSLQEFGFRKTVRAPLRFVFRWCTDYRDDDDRMTDSLYHYRAQIVLREPDRVVRIITVPGRNRNRSTDVELISLRPPDRWRLQKFSVSDDETGWYRLTRHGRGVTAIHMRFRRRWKLGPPPNLTRYRALFHRVWDRYVEVMEREYRHRPSR